MPIYTMPEDHYFTLEGKIEFLNKRALKIGLEPVSISVISKEVRLVKFWDIYRVNSWNMPVTFCTVEVTGESPKIEGWTLEGKIEHGESGNIIKSISGKEIPAKFRDIGALCDYCHKDRRRVSTFVLSDDTSGDYKQVGKNCLKDFTGYPNAEGLAEYAEGFNAILREAEESSNGDLFKGRRIELYDLRTFLSFTSAIIKKYGWESRSSGAMITTADRVLEHITSGKDGIYPSEADYKEAEEAIEAVKNAINAKKSPSDYEWNLSTIINGLLVNTKTAGYAASIMPFYYRVRSIQIENDKKAAESKSQFLGKIGEKIQLRATLLMTLNIDSLYPSILHKFLDSAGNIIVWYAAMASYSYTLETGKEYQMKGTIKDHKQYRGENQTIITRAKLEEVS